MWEFCGTEQEEQTDSDREEKESAAEEGIGSGISKAVLVVSRSSSKTSFFFLSFSLSSDDFNFILLRKQKYLIKNFKSSHYCGVCPLLQHPVIPLTALASLPAHSTLIP